MRLANCQYQQGEETFLWLACLDNNFLQYRAAGSALDDAEMKQHQAESMVHLLGAGGGVSYREWKEQMMRKEEEFEQNGQIAGQQLAEELLDTRRHMLRHQLRLYIRLSEVLSLSNVGRAIHRIGAQTQGVFSRGGTRLNRAIWLTEEEHNSEVLMVEVQLFLGVLNQHEEGKIYFQFTRSG